MGVDFVILYNTRFRLFPGKLKSKWNDPYLITHLFPHREVELETKEAVRFKVNRQRIKIYFGHLQRCVLHNLYGCQRPYSLRVSNFF